MLRLLSVVAAALLALPFQTNADVQYVQYSREDAAAMPIDSALEIADSYMGSAWMKRRIVSNCSNLLASIEAGRPALIQTDLEVGFDWFSGVVANKNKLLYVARFQSGGMNCHQGTVKPVAGDGVDLASALYRISLEDDLSSLISYYSRMSSDIEGLDAGDRLIAQGTSYERAIPLIHEFARQQVGKADKTAKSFSIPAVPDMVVRASDVARFEGGLQKSSINVSLTNVSANSVSIWLRKVTRSNDLDSEIIKISEGVTSQYEMPAGDLFYTDDKSRTYLVGFDDVITEEREDVFRKGQSGYFPAAMGRPIHFRQSYVQQSGKLIGAKKKSIYRTCVPVFESQFDVGGSSRKTLVFECASYSSEKSLGSNAAHDNEFRALETVAVCLKTGVPLHYESVIAGNFSGRESHSIYEYKVESIHEPGTGSNDKEGVERATIGVSLADIKPGWESGLQLADTQGALVTYVVSGSPGKWAGIRAGDVIRKVSGKRVTSVDDVISALTGQAPGASHDIVIWRDGGLISKQVYLEKAELVMKKLPKDCCFNFMDAFWMRSTVPMTQGLESTLVLQGGESARKNVKQGDLITHIADKPVSNFEELRQAITQVGRGRVSVKYARPK